MGKLLSEKIATRILLVPALVGVGYGIYKYRDHLLNVDTSVRQPVSAPANPGSESLAGGFFGAQGNLTETNPFSSTVVHEPLALPTPSPTISFAPEAPKLLEGLNLDSCIAGTKVPEGTKRFAFGNGTLPSLDGVFTDVRKLTGTGMQVLDAKTGGWIELCNVDEQGALVKLLK